MAELVLDLVWSDPELIEISVTVGFGGWAGQERAYATRSEVLAFAAAMEAVANGNTEARLDAGQPELSWIELRVYEYTRARRLGLAIRLGRAGSSISNWEHGDTKLEFAVPIERGALPAFAHGLRSIVAEERGQVHLPVLEDWP
jgi:hypothetical protein